MTGSSEEVRSGTSGENEEVAALQQHDSPVGGDTESEQKSRTAASWVIYLSASVCQLMEGQVFLLFQFLLN